MRLRTSLARASLFVALALVASSVLSACSGGGKHTKEQSSTSTRPKVAAIRTSVLKVGKVDVESAGPPNVQIDTATGKAVLHAAQIYIDDALFAPLKTGNIGKRFGSLFDPGVKPTAVGPDRGPLTNVGVGKLATFTTKASPVELSALVGTLGELIYVATDFKLVVHTKLGGDPATLTHDVELTFAKSGKSWLVTAYRVRTVRKTATRTTTTTASRGTATTGGTKP